MTDAELTRKVAERLGWTNLQTRHKWGGPIVGCPPDSICTPVALPDFATDLNAAWGLLGKMPLRRTIRDDGDDIECRLEILPESGGTVSIVWVDECGGFIETAALGESPARALCLAFLAATEGR